MGERSSEVCPIYGTVARGFGRVNIFASAAVELDGFLVCDVGQADREERLGLAKNTRTAPEVDFLVLLELDGTTIGYL